MISYVWRLWKTNKIAMHKIRRFFFFEMNVVSYWVLTNRSNKINKKIIISERIKMKISNILETKERK